MIFVTTGTEKHPFDRLIAEVDRLAAAGAFADCAVLIQTGSSTYTPKACATAGLLSYGEMVEKVRAARLVIAHGGAGSFMLCHQQRVPLIMVPRLRRLGENVDDHQVLFCRRLAERGMLDCVEDVAELGAATRRLLERPRTGGEPRGGTRLTTALAALAEEWTLESRQGTGR